MDTALALHHACTNGAPTEDIDAILLGNNKEITRIVLRNDSEKYTKNNELRQHENFGQFDLRQIPQESFVSDLCTHDACLDVNSLPDESFLRESYQLRQLSKGSSICLFDSEEKFENPSLNSSIEQDTIPLTSDALCLKNDIENGLISKRASLWGKHKHSFALMRAEIKDILEERKVILKEFKKKEDELSNLCDKYDMQNQVNESYDEIYEANKSIVKRFRLRLSRKKPSADDYVYDIGMASTHLHDLERYYYELEEKHMRLKQKYKSQYQSIFSEIDKLIELTLCIRIDGSSSKC